MTPLNLGRSLPIRDVRKLIWSYLDGNDFEVVKCAQNSKRVPVLDMKECIRKGHLDLLVYASRWNIIPDQICQLSAYHGHLEMLQWARANGCRWDAWTCIYASQNNHLEVLKWARENGCAWTSWICKFAAKNGNLEMLKWARANGCHWNKMTCEAALRGGHLELLQWARENGCPEE